MGYSPSPTPRTYSPTGAETDADPAVQGAVQPPLPVKMVIAGGFGVGKTTSVASISEITPLTTEASITSVSADVDDLAHTPYKATTTVAMDFGCITIDPTLKLYLFGTPGQERFKFMWDDLVRGALGALVIVDTRRMDDCYVAVDYFEDKGIPFAVGVNHFEGEVMHTIDEVRWALDVEERVPLFTFDARDRGSVRDALLTVLKVALARTAA